MNNTTERVGKVRAWLQHDDERRERETALPRSICNVCGGRARAGEGSREPEPFTGLAPHPANPSRRVVISAPHAPEDADGWRRTCAICVEATAGEIVGAVVGHAVSDADARNVIGRMHRFDEADTLVQEFPTAQAMGHATGRPWAHLSAEQRERVQQVLREVTRDRQIGPCVQGACGVCGRRSSRRWFAAPAFLRWPDGDAAPVCAECQEVADRRPEPQSIEELRVIGVECATGFAQWGYTAPPAFRLYAEAKDADGNGHAEPWDYGDGIREFREQMWTDRPSLAPADQRDEYVHHARKRIEEATRQEQAERDAAHAAAW